MPLFGDAEAVEDFLLGWRDSRRDCLAGAVDGDGRGSQQPELLDDVGDGQAAAFLDVVRDGQGGDDDGQVGFDGVAGAVEHGAGAEVAFFWTSERPARPSTGRDMNRPGFDGGSGYWISTRVWSVRFLA